MNINPIPPRSIVRLKNLWTHAQRQGHKKGEIRIIGYYSKHDGLDCVWLANAFTGAYEWTTDHEWLAETVNRRASLGVQLLFGCNALILPYQNQRGVARRVGDE